jgi:CRISPR system Cascade subunit CasA
MNHSFDLTKENWIPCSRLEGGPVRDYSIRDVLVEAHLLREIDDSSPLVTVSLLRLLLAILSRSSGSLSMSEWVSLWNRNSFPDDGIDSYLDRWRDSFDLFHPERPFYQRGNFETINAAGQVAKCYVLRLFAQAPDKNGKLLFDHHSYTDPPFFTPVEAAKALIAYQTFCLGGGVSSAARIDGRVVARPNAADGIAARGPNVWVAGDNLFQTCMLNLGLMEVNADDVPCWERENPHEDMDVHGRPKISSGGLLDRLTWQSRLVRLIPEAYENGIGVRAAYVTQGRSADTSSTDPLLCYFVNKKEGWSPVRLNEDKSAWRDAHSLLDLTHAGKLKPARGIGFAHRASRALGRKPGILSLHVVGLVSEPGQAKITLWRHDRMPVPTVLLEDESLVDILSDGLKFAERVALSRFRRIRGVAEYMLAPNKDDPKARQPDTKERERLAKLVDPRRAYWPRLEERFHSFLLKLAEDSQTALGEWRKDVGREARRAFDESCEALGSGIRVRAAVAKESAARKAASDKRKREKERKGAHA